MRFNGEELVAEPGDEQIDQKNCIEFIRSGTTCPLCGIQTTFQENKLDYQGNIILAELICIHCKKKFIVGYQASQLIFLIDEYWEGLGNEPI